MLGCEFAQGLGRENPYSPSSSPHLCRLGLGQELLSACTILKRYLETPNASMDTKTVTTTLVRDGGRKGVMRDLNLGSGTPQSSTEIAGSCMQPHGLGGAPAGAWTPGFCLGQGEGSGEPSGFAL